MRLAPRPVFLAGREELLAELNTRLSAGDSPGLRIVALCGLAGAGKTSMAVEYAHRHLAEVRLAWQFAAEDSAVLVAEFGELAAQLGARDVLDARDPVSTVHGVLAAYPAEWLLVFDNAPDRAAVEPFLPPAGPGRVLVTSQSALWPPGQGMDVPVLDPEAAAGFLAARTGDPNRQAAADLAAELGGGYLATFRQRREDLFARGAPTGYGKTIATTWSLAFGRLESSVPSAVSLLRLLACCAAEAIPLSLLLQPRPGLTEKLGADVVPPLVPLLDDPLATGDAIAALRRFSLVTPAGDGSVSVHRLVQAVTAGQMPADLAGQWRQAAAALIEAAIPADTDPPETWPVCAALLPHAQAALADDSAGMMRIANYLGERGSRAAARDLQQRIVDARVLALGPDHPDTLTARAGLAWWTGDAGDAAEARDQYAALLPAMERVLGPEHPDTLRTRADLAWCTGDTGDPAAARDQYAALLPAMERVLGSEHPDTLGARADLALWTGDTGDAAAARDQYAALLPAMERVLGYAALLPVREQVLGPEHPDTLSNRHNLARWTRQAGDPAAARDMLAGLLPVRERVLGPEHPDTLRARADLARWTGEAEAAS